MLWCGYNSSHGKIAPTPMSSEDSRMIVLQQTLYSFQLSITSMCLTHFWSWYVRTCFQSGKSVHVSALSTLNPKKRYWKQNTASHSTEYSIQGNILAEMLFQHTLWRDSESMLTLSLLLILLLWLWLLSSADSEYSGITPSVLSELGPETAGC